MNSLYFLALRAENLYPGRVEWICFYFKSVYLLNSLE